MDTYDPDIAPDPAEWLALDEGERIMLAEEYHRLECAELPNLFAHAIFHAIVENQLAEKFDPSVRAMARITRQGLDRHDAIHAIGSVVAEFTNNLARDNADKDSEHAIFLAELERLSASSWLNQT